MGTACERHAWVLLAVGGALGFLGVAVGAFGAHALKDTLGEDPARLGWYQTASHYHLVHALAVLAAGLSAANRPRLRTAEGPAAAGEPAASSHPMKGRGCLLAAGWLWALGVVVFSGSLYTMALLDLRWLGAVTPVGGVLFLLGWGSFITGAIRVTLHRP